VTKSSTIFLAVLAVISEDGKMSDADLADYVSSSVQDPVSRVPGVGETQLFGAPYAMRIWLDPSKLNQYKLTPADISSAIQAQNAQVSAGEFGGTPSVKGQQLNATITAQTRLQTVDQFEQILLRTQTDGSQVHLSDVARVELGSENYAVSAHFNGKPAVGLAIKLATGANALDTIKAVEAKMDELQPYFPTGMKVVKPYDTTPFVRIAVEEVIKTLVEAVILVFLVMYLFLQNFRATLIPTIAVPVVLLGTFGVLMATGFTINTLTMFAMVLAIGLLVDDAIVVVENVERVMSEEGLSPKEATKKSMGQISGALVGVALVLAAVFVPMAFFGGSTGVIYRQFSITIVSAMTLSVLTAMVLTPALCATLLKPVEKGHTETNTGFFGWFNRSFRRSSQAYGGAVQHVLHRSRRYLVIYAVLALLVVGAYLKLPKGFLPDEDQGTVFTLVQLPPTATKERTREVLKQIEKHYLVDEKDAVASVFSVGGFSFAGSGQNMGLVFVMLKPWDERQQADLKASAVAARAMQAFTLIRDASVFAVTPPAVSELGNASGFDLMLEDRANLGHEALMQARNQLLGMAAQEPGLAAVRPNGMDDTPQFELSIDKAKATALGLTVADINSVLSAAWGSAYVDDFIDKGRVKKIYLQGDAAFRMVPEDLGRWYARNSAGQMVRFDAFATGHWTTGSPRLERYNGEPSVEILGMGIPGMLSSGEAHGKMEELAARLPRASATSDGALAAERQAGSQATALYVLSVLIVFLCLAALYESWSIPVAVILVVPLGVLGALVAAMLTWKLNDVYFQVGLLTTVGLASKNAILIIEFAKDLVAQGRGYLEAAVEAARLRLRPIVMTSLAFVLGIVPLAHSNGAGSGAQNALGNAVIGGMLTGTFLAIFFVPLFFVVVMRLFNRTSAAGHPPAEQTPANVTEVH
ncbi:efflux RND transporter permease subunit, partial [Ideonella sp. B508-1]|uniref:efflux RND transporter permease subunit n=1 Tax=Ideonella sp. B508-1 TaxID=137716 RepID=UPI0003B77813